MWYLSQFKLCGRGSIFCVITLRRRDMLHDNTVLSTSSYRTAFAFLSVWYDTPSFIRWTHPCRNAARDYALS